MIVDVHAHLDFEEFQKDFEEVIQRAKKAGVTTIICNGVNPNSNRKILELSSGNPLLKVALGYYPCDCDKVSKDNFKEEIAFIRRNKNKIIAIGEVGLDKKWAHDYDRQKECFRELIKLAKDIDKPLIVHSRQAEEDTIQIIEELEAKKVVMHCFMGKKKLVERIIKNGWNFSIPAIVVKSEQLQEIVKICPLRQLLTETDSPVLSPREEKRNEPSFIVDGLKKIAEIKGLDVEEAKNIMFSNYQRVFL